MSVKKQVYRFCALSLVLILLLSLFTACDSSKAKVEINKLRKEAASYSALRGTGTLQANPKSPDELTLIQNNEWLTLYYKEKTAEVLVFDKRSGLWWLSNPENANTPAARSQLSISTINSKGVAKQYTSYTDSLVKGQVEYKIRSGITVTYTFGNPKTDFSLLPRRLTDARYDEIKERAIAAGVSESLLKRRYNYADGVWSLKETITNEQAKKLREFFDSIDYTEEELAKDNEGTNAQIEDDSFSIPLTYTLQDDSLRVFIDGEALVYPKNEIITSLDVLEYFGALTENEDGYMFVPDGSGALVDSKKSGGLSKAVLPVYGRDETIPQKVGNTVGENCLLPVFGICKPNGGVLTVIEDNEAIASIDVVKPGYVDDYATVSAAFALNAVQNIGLASDSISKFYITTDTKYTGETALRYVFLSGKDADYVGMAGVYRDYLDKIGNRSVEQKSDALPFFLETVGAVSTKTSSMGFVHSTLAPLTTYEENIVLLKSLRERGIDNILLILSGWMNGGVDSGLPDDVETVDVLGGKKGLDALIKWTTDNKINIYPQVLLNTFSADEGLSAKNKYSAYSLDGKKSYISKYEKVTGVALQKGKRYLISPLWQSDFADKMINSLKNNGFSGVSLGDISTTVYSDYHAEKEALRQEARIQSGQITESFAKAFPELMLKAPNDLTALNSRIYTDVPKSSSDLNIEMCSVPFYEMVYHGYAQYSFTAMNYDVDFTKSVLKCAEYGGCPKFQFIAQSEGKAGFLDKEAYYASYYENWLDSACEAYAFLNELLAPVSNSRITGHICLADGVYRTDYENGMSVYVNYNSKPVTVESVTIDSQTAIRKENKS